MLCCCNKRFKLELSDSKLTSPHANMFAFVLEKKDVTSVAEWDATPVYIAVAVSAMLVLCVGTVLKM